MHWHHVTDYKAGANLPACVCPTTTCPALPCLAALPACSCLGAQHRAGSGVPKLGWASQHAALLLP